MIGFTKDHRQRYRVRLEEAGLRADPYAWLIPGRFGDIYVHGPGMFGVATHSAKGPLVGRLRRLPFAKVTQDGSDGANVVFPAEHLKTIARMVKARRRRNLTPEQRATAAERLKKYAFQSDNKRSENASEGRVDQRCTPAA